MKLITIKSLTKRFGENTILENVNAEIGKGEIVAIIGPSGTGKSTLLRAVNMLEPPTSGEVYFGGELLNKRNIDRARRNMGMVFQNFGLFSHLTVLQNVSIGQTELLGKGKAEADENSRVILKRVGLAERAGFYPSELSGGQKQRTAIARSLAMNPEVILFDEPTSALDPTMVGEVTSVMRGLRDSGITMLIVTHEMKFAREIANRVFYMDEGGIYEDGTPDEIFDSPKRSKTRDFINRTRRFNFELASADSDIWEMLNGVENFCRGAGLDSKRSRRAVLVAEELAVSLCLPLAGGCSLSVSCSDASDGLSVLAAYGGEARNLLETPDERYAIPLSIVKNTAKAALYGFTDGKSSLEIQI